MSAKRSKLRRGLEIGGAIVVLVAIFVISEDLLCRKVGPGDARRAAGRTWTGSTATAALLIVGDPVEAAGSVAPIRLARVAARIQGQVDGVDVHTGDRVRAGQLLVTTSAPELASRSAAAASAAGSAEAVLQQARRDLARMERLRVKEAATTQELERAREAVDVATGNAARARASARAEADVAEQARLVAPFDGVVLERLVDPGDLASPGRVLVAVADDSAWRLEAAVDEQAAVALAVGVMARCSIEALAFVGECVVSEMAPAADPATRTVLVKADLPPITGLRPGLFGRLATRGPSREAVVVPPSAVHRVGGLASLRVVGSGGALELRHVRVGPEHDGLVEILSGLAAGEIVAAP